MHLFSHQNRFVDIADSGNSPMACFNEQDLPAEEGGGGAAEVSEKPPAIDVVAIDQEKEPPAKKEEPKVEVASGDSLEHILDDLYGESDDKQSATFKAILSKPEALKAELQKRSDDPVVKTLIRELRSRAKQQGTKKGEVLNERESVISRREAELVVRESDFVARQEAFAKISDNPDIKALLEKADVEVDPSDVDGMVTKKVAQSMKGFLDPMRQENAKFKAQRTLGDLYRQFPRLQSDKAFKSKVAGLVKARKESGSPISTQDAIQLVEYKEHVERKKASKKARSASAANIGRRSGPSGRSDKVGVPVSIRKRGAVAVAKYLRENPEMAKRIRAEGAYSRV